MSFMSMLDNIVVHEQRGGERNRNWARNITKFFILVKALSNGRCESKRLSVPLAKLYPIQER